MSLITRLSKIEAAAAERQAAEHAATLSEFNTWADAKLSMSRAEAEAILARYAPLTPDEAQALDHAWERVPADLRERLVAP